MTKDEALKLAFEVLKRVNMVDDDCNFFSLSLAQSVTDALDAIKEALAQPEQEPENRCVRELREFAKSNQGASIFPSWDGHRVLKYLGDTTPPKAHPLTVEDVRAADGIVHSDGNIFFTNLAQLNAAHKIGGQQ